MNWDEIERDMNMLENNCALLLKDIETKELAYQEKHGDIEYENAILLKEIEDLNNENSALKLELSKIQSVNEGLKKKYESAQNNISDNENSCLALRNGLEMCENDSLRMKKAKEMLQVGKDVTRIRWDYSAPPNTLRGYFSNKDKKILEHFDLDKDKLSEDKTEEYLWKHMEANSSSNWNDLVSLAISGEKVVNKENVQKNN